LNLKGVGAGSQPFVLWKDKPVRHSPLTYDHDVLQIEGDAESGRKVPATREKQGRIPQRRRGAQEIGNETGATRCGVDHSADEAKRAQHEAHSRIRRDFRCVLRSERGRIFLDRPKDNKTKAGC